MTALASNPLYPSDTPTTLGECEPGNAVSIPGWSDVGLVGWRSKDVPDHIRVDPIGALGDLGDHEFLRDDTLCYRYERAAVPS